MLIPIGHDRGDVWRFPVVTVSLMVACFLTFLFQREVMLEEQEASLAAFQEVIEYLFERPWLEPDENLRLPPGLLDELERIRTEVREHELVNRVNVDIQQRKLDELVATWSEVVAEGPTRFYGFVPAEPKPFGLLMHMFTHGDWFHLLGNLLFLYLVGGPLEDLWGRLFFALFYFASGVASAYLHGLWGGDPTLPLIGASGAIAGLMGAFLVRLWKAKIRLLFLVWPVFFKTFSLPSALVLPAWLWSELFFAGVARQSPGLGDGVARFAHIGGFGFGVLVALAIRLSGFERDHLRPAVGAKVGLEEHPEVERAWESFRAGDTDGAVRVLREALRKRPGDPELHISLWRISRNAGRTSEVVGQIGRVIRDLLRRGDRETALDLLHEVLEIHPELPFEPTLKVAIAEGLVKSDETEFAETLVRSALEDGRSLPEGAILRVGRLAKRLAPDLLPKFVREQLEAGLLEEHTRSLLVQLCPDVRPE